MSQTEEQFERPGRSRRLVVALDAAWATMAQDYGLLPQLAPDAVLARSSHGELVAATPRLLQLLVEHQFTVAEAADVVTRLGDHPWLKPQRQVIQEVLDAWWHEVLMLNPGEHPPQFGPEVVLGILAGYDAPMIRWFEPWIDQLDGPGAVHLAAIIVGGRDRLTEAAWAGKDDRGDQIFGWARSETVINGIALVGGTHLDDEVLSQALDRMI